MSQIKEYRAYLSRVYNFGTASVLMFIPSIHALVLEGLKI